MPIKKLASKKSDGDSLHPQKTLSRNALGVTESHLIQPTCKQSPILVILLVKIKL